MTKSLKLIRPLCTLILLLVLASQVFASSTRIPNFTSPTYDKVYIGQAPASYLPYWHGYHFWKKSVGEQVVPQLVSWTEHLYNEVSKSRNLVTVDPKGIRHLCPNYVNLSREKRILFWTRLISIMASFESGYNPHTTYNEPTMRGVRSVGLLQLSNVSSQIDEYNCTMISGSSPQQNLKDLSDPKKNLSCGVRIIDYWIGRDKVLADNVRDPEDGSRYWRGLARFWGVFRHPKLKDPSTARSYWDEIDTRRSRWQEQSRKRDLLTSELLKDARRSGEPWGHFEWKVKSTTVPHPSLMEDYYSKHEQHRLTSIVRLANQTGFCF